MNKSPNIIKTYFSLTKPGMVLGNLMPAVAGFVLASQGHINLSLFLATLLGLSFVMASACVFNNYLDQDIDELMERTKSRALAQKLISKPSALIFGTILGVIGFFSLILYTNLIATLTALAGFLVYVVIYSPLKRRTVHGTLIGSISGATPPVVGYTAVTNHLDLGAGILFLILMLWQMPHFYAISIYRIDDYKKAKIPVLPIIKGIFFTKINMTLYIILFILVIWMLNILGFTGLAYLIVATLIGLVWLGYCIKGFSSDNDGTVPKSTEASAKVDKVWARKMFFLSLLVITIFCIIIPVDVWLRNII